MSLGSCLFLWWGSHYNTDPYKLTSAGNQYFAPVAVLNIYALHDLNGLDAYSSCSVYEQDSVVAKHKKENYVHAIAYVVYSM